MKSLSGGFFHALTGALIGLCRIEIASRVCFSAPLTALIGLCRIEILALLMLFGIFLALIGLCRIEILPGGRRPLADGRL